MRRQHVEGCDLRHGPRQRCSVEIPRGETQEDIPSIPAQSGGMEASPRFWRWVSVGVLAIEAAWSAVCMILFVVLWVAWQRGDPTDDGLALLVPVLMWIYPNVLLAPFVVAALVYLLLFDFGTRSTGARRSREDSGGGT
jgi:hypothetical protein